MLFFLQWIVTLFGIPGALLVDWLFSSKKDNRWSGTEASMAGFFGLAFWCGIVQTLLVLMGGAFLLGLSLAH